MNFILHSPGDSMSNSGFFFFPTGYTLLVLYFPLQWELSMYSLNLQQMKVQNPNLKIFFLLGPFPVTVIVSIRAPAKSKWNNKTLVYIKGEVFTKGIITKIRVGGHTGSDGNTGPPAAEMPATKAPGDIREWVFWTQEEEGSGRQRHP